jgi:eukaryotic-like serine/threonine-protein kinase
MVSTPTTVAGPKSDAESRRALRLAPGDIVADRYEVEELLGSGGMGVVVAARHRTLGHRVAVKFLTAWSDAEGFVRFSREARIIASLESEHVVRVIDYGMHGAMPFMAMELLAGRDLGRELKERGTLPVAEAVDCVIQACDGLAEAHAKGVVHRDVKLANLFLAVRADGERIVKLLDFGVSKVLADGGDEVDLTRTSCMIGSPLYMSPEQIRDPRSVDGRADIWSLGIVLHKLLTAGAPFEGQTTSALCAAVAADAPTRLRAQAPHLPPELEAVVLRCLEKRPADRHPSVISFASALAPFASDVGRRIATRLVDLAPPGVWAVDPPSVAPGSASGTNGGEQSVATSSSAVRYRRARVGAAVIALAGLVAGVAGLPFFLRESCCGPLTSSRDNGGPASLDDRGRGGPHLGRSSAVCYRDLETSSHGHRELSRSARHTRSSGASRAVRGVDLDPSNRAGGAAGRWFELGVRRYGPR